MKPRARTSSVAPQVKVVGQSGQISLGKHYAGKTLRVEHGANGTIVLVPVALVPESQLWTLSEPHRSRIERGLAWAATHPPAETDLDDLAQQAVKHKSRRRSGRSR